MNSQDFNQLVDETVQATADLLVSKGSEYSNEDRLSNFKIVGKQLGLTPLQVAMVYMTKHFIALSTYTEKEAKGLTQTLSEPIEGRIHDLINYCFLVKGLIQEEGNSPWQQLDLFDDLPKIYTHIGGGFDSQCLCRSCQMGGK